MGFGDFIKDVGGAIGNVAKAGAWVANPTHWDDIAEGVGNAAEFVVENPGKAWDTGFEVGRAVVKDQLDPVNLAINAGLIGLTVATGGAAAPALLAKAGLGAKSTAAGISAAKGVTTAARAADTASDVVRGANTVSKGVRAADKALEAGGALQRLGKPGRAIDRGIEALSGTGIKNRAAQRILDAGGEAPSLLRQGLAATVQGAGRKAPTALEGMSEGMALAQRTAWRAKRLEKKVGQVQAAGEVAEAVADPVGYTVKKAEAREEADGSTDTGYVDRGHTGGVGESTARTIPTRAEEFGTGYTDRGQTRASRSADELESASQAVGIYAGQMPGQWKPSQHFWSGPTREWAGGVGVSHDWRPSQMRNIEYPSVGIGSAYNTAKRTADPDSLIGTPIRHATGDVVDTVLSRRPQLAQLVKEGVGSAPHRGPLHSQQLPTHVSESMAMAGYAGSSTASTAIPGSANFSPEMEKAPAVSFPRYQTGSRVSGRTPPPVPARTPGRKPPPRPF